MEHFYQNIHGWFNYEDFYRQVVRNLPDPAHIVEVGIWKGASAAFMAVEIINSGKKIKFDCVDTWKGSDLELHQTDPEINDLYRVFMDNMKPVYGHFTPVRLPSLDAAILYMDNSLDFVFIDAAHDYENIKKDIIAWRPKIKKGGILSGHDYDFGDVKRAVDEELSGLEPKLLGPCWFVQL